MKKITIAGKTYDIITLDFETYYADDYTLSGKELNTSEYIRDDRFKVHGVGIRKGRRSVRWVSCANVGKELGKINWSKTALLCHNTPFDGFILSHVYGHVPGFYLDTLAMSRACRGHHVRHGLDYVAKDLGLLGKVKRDKLYDTKNKINLTKAESDGLGDYCVDDVNDTLAVFEKMLPHFPEEELRLVDLTCRMFCDPVLLIDTPRVQAELDREISGKVGALLIAGVTPKDLMSNPKFENLLLNAGATVPYKTSLRTGKQAPAFAATDEGFRALLKDLNPKIRNLCNARLKIKSTIGETRAKRFLEAGLDNMPLPVLLKYSGAHTHRWSGDNKMNLQNLVRGGELRRSILAPPGHVLVVADSEQIEARMLAWIAGQLEVTEAFANGDDVYKLAASAIYGKPADQITPDERFLGKVCTLALGYGMGHKKLQATLKQGALGGPPVDMTLGECQYIVNVYRRRNWAIGAFWERMGEVIKDMNSGTEGAVGPLQHGKGFIRLPSGLFLQYYGLHDTVEVNMDGYPTIQTTYLTRLGRTKLYGGLLTENVVQALCRDVIATQMLAISEKYRVVTMTHDEIVCCVPLEQADECYKFMVKTMSTTPVWAKGLPLGAKGGYDVCYSK